MKSPRNIKEVQALTFFKVRRKASRFEWVEECELAFHQLKEVLAKLPLLTKPITGEILYIYLSVGERAFSSVLVREERSRQLPLYYASKLLRGAEVGYPKIEKVGALVSAARKLQPYFLSHPIVVRTNFPLNTTLGRVDASGRMMKWAVELGQFEISYEPRVAIKGQALVNFIQEATHENRDQRTWMLFVDGSVTIEGAVLACSSRPGRRGARVRNQTRFQSIQ